MTTERDDDRRRFRRVWFDAPVSIDGSGSSVTTTLVDISLNGVLLVRPGDWAGQTGDSVRLSIQLGENTNIRMKVQIAHHGPETIGLQCEEIDLESVSHLKRLVELNLGDQNLLERELAALG